MKVMSTQGEDKRRNEYQNGMSYGMAQFLWSMSSFTFASNPRLDPNV